MAALESMGFVCDLGPGLWLVRTRFTSGVIRNTLSQTLERGDRFVVIDATRDRLAWFNLGPEVDVRIGKVWNGPLAPNAAVALSRLGAAEPASSARQPIDQFAADIESTGAQRRRESGGASVT